MRFSYIDNKGNEVELHSVEALAARIELSAVTSSTELYDASTETWGPADGHEVYRQLLAEAAARDFGPTNGSSSLPFPAPRADSGEEGATGFVEETAPDQTPELAGAQAPEFGTATDAALGADTTNSDSSDESPPESLVQDSVFDLELSIDTTHTSPLKPEPVDPATELGAVDLPGRDVESATEEPSFSLADGLEVEDLPTDLSANDTAVDRQPPMGGFSASAADAWEQEGPQFSADEELVLEPVEATSSQGEVTDNPWGAPSSEPEHPFDDDAQSFADSKTTGANGVWPDADLSEDEEATGALRSLQNLLTSPGVQWGFLAGSFLVMAFFGSGVVQGLLLRGVLTVAGVLAVGVLTGVFLWRNPENRTLIPAATFGLVALASVPLFLVGSRVEAATAPDSQQTVATVRSASASRNVPTANAGERAMEGRAVEEVIHGMDSLAMSYGLDRRPADWLHGIYLANASEFAGVEEYWQRYGAYLDDVRSQDANWFRSSYESRLVAAGISSAAIPGLVDRGVARFQSSSDLRNSLYDGMQQLVDGALALHAFLIQNEDTIDYEPWDEGGLSEDPVVEAVVRSSDVEDQMWSMIARIAVSLEAVTDLGETSPEHLQAALLDSMRASIR